MAGEPPQRARVLVVEDALIPRLALSRGVEHEGHEALPAGHGRDALDVLVREHVDMVLLDLVMPEVDGFEVLAQMRGNPELRDIPVLVISAVEATSDVARAIEMGAIDCLAKPVEPALLRVRMRTALEQARLRRMEQAYLRQELTLRQQERLAMLGRLSAGLSHELNNPAAAALSTARQLQQALEQADVLLPRLLARPRAATLLDGAAILLPPAEPHLTGSERSALADELEDVLGGSGVDQPWVAAEELARSGATADAVASWLARLGDDAGTVVAWVVVQARIRRAVNQIAGSVGRMADLTSALRGYTYVDRAPRQDVDVRRGLDDTLTILAHKLPKGVEVRRRYAADLPTIQAYGGQLNQVWTNLIDNAIDAVGERGTVTVRAQPHDGGVQVTIEDDGSGIPEDLRGQVFDPFVTTKPPGHGTGLGLSISHQIVTQAHGGSLTVQSEPGRTAFEARLPATPPPEERR